MPSTSKCIKQNAVPNNEVVMRAYSRGQYLTAAIITLAFHLAHTCMMQQAPAMVNAVHFTQLQA